MKTQIAVKSSVVSIGQTSIEQTYARLCRWDCNKIKKHAVKKGLYTAEEIDGVETEYKKYLAICIAFPKQSFPTPAKLDAFWHEHILFTQDYAAMCQSVSGYFLHHLPFVDGEKADASGKYLLEQKYLLMFGEAPNSMWSADGLCSPNPNCEGKSLTLVKCASCQTCENRLDYFFTFSVLITQARLY